MIKNTKRKQINNKTWGKSAQFSITDMVLNLQKWGLLIPILFLDTMSSNIGDLTKHCLAKQLCHVFHMLASKKGEDYICFLVM